ncbi:MAG: hypothetical protein R2769_12565 [Saprospiraceae bacterium]
MHLEVWMSWLPMQALDTLPSIEDMTAEQWQETIDLNLASVFTA